MAGMRKCIGSAKFGIEAHEAPVEDFPSQPSQKDGLGRMCKPHWNQYTAGLARERKALLAAEAAVESPVVPAAGRKVRTKAATTPEPIRTKPARRRKTEGDPIVEAGEATVEEVSNA
ncbi:MAG: hypothetical protein M0Z49_06225 [Chloroflexi bacterium]|nr:hypothetical protein [Chloroflexota bacterium]